MENFNIDFEKLQQQEVVTFIDKHDYNIILDALQSRDDTSKQIFQQKYSQEEIKKLSEVLLGQFTDFKGKTMFVSDALLATATTSILLLPFVPDEQFKQIPQQQMEQLNQAYDMLIKFYTSIGDKF